MSRIRHLVRKGEWLETMIDGYVREGEAPYIFSRILHRWLINCRHYMADVNLELMESTFDEERLAYPSKPADMRDAVRKTREMLELIVMVAADNG